MILTWYCSFSFSILHDFWKRVGPVDPLVQRELDWGASRVSILWAFCARERWLGSSQERKWRLHDGCGRLLQSILVSDFCRLNALQECLLSFRLRLNPDYLGLLCCCQAVEGIPEWDRLTYSAFVYGNRCNFQNSIGVFCFSMFRKKTAHALDILIPICYARRRAMTQVYKRPLRLLMRALGCGHSKMIAGCQLRLSKKI